MRTVTIASKRELLEMIDRPVKKTYNGRPGCMCGCIGSWKYPNRDLKQAASDRGYAIDKSEVSDKAVERRKMKVYRTIRLMPDDELLLAQANGSICVSDGNVPYISVDIEGRRTAIYF